MRDVQKFDFLLHLKMARTRSAAVKAAVAAAAVPKVLVWHAEDGPRVIELSITASQIGDVDSIAETCHARLWIDVYWLPSATELDAEGSSSPSTWDVAANLQAVNATESELRVVNAGKIKHNVGGDRTMWHAVLELSGTFRQSLDLRSFPLDCQALVLRLEMGNVKSMVYRPAAHQTTALSVEAANCSLAGWAWIGAAINFTNTDPALSKQGNSYAQCVVDFKIARHFSGYIHRVVLFTFFVMCSSSLVFLMDPLEQFVDRLSFLFTLLLAIVAFQYTVSEKLPDTPYITLLESYNLASSVLVFLISVWCGCIKYFSSSSCVVVVVGQEECTTRSELIDVDASAFKYYVVLLAVAHIGAVWYAVQERRRQRKKVAVAKAMPPASNIKVLRDDAATAEDGSGRYACLLE